MPNWCTNEVDVIGDVSNQAEFEAFLIQAGLDTEDNRTQATSYNGNHNLFSRLVPMPEDIRNSIATISNPGEFENAIAHNLSAEYTDWYTWSIAHWGTKWDIDLAYAELEGNVLSLSYDTAWSPPLQFWETTSKQFPSLTIKTRYLEEGMSFIGETEYKGGQTIKDISLDITKEMYVAAGATLNKDGDIDWDIDQEYNLFSLFEDGLHNWDNKLEEIVTAIKGENK